MCLTGCFGAVDINDLAMVMAIGVDKGEQPGTIAITVQVARPSDAVGQTGAPSGGTGEPMWVATGEGKTLFSAMRNLTQYASRKLYFAHNKVIVLSEDIARSGVTDVVDFFSRNHELRMRTWVVVTPGKARDLIAAKTGLEVLPGDSIDKLFRYTRLVADAPKTDMKTLQADFLENTKDAVLPKLTLEPRQISEGQEQSGNAQVKPQAVLSGTAYFHQGKMKGWLDAKESRGMMWFVNPPQSRVLTLQCPDSPTEKVALEMKKYRFDVIPGDVYGKPTFLVRLSARFEMVELGCSTNRSNLQIMHGLNQQAARKLQQEILNIVNVSKHESVDFLGLGDRFQDAYPEEWKKLGPHFSDRFLPKIQVNVHVTTYIRSPALLEQPMTPQ